MALLQARWLALGVTLATVACGGDEGSTGAGPGGRTDGGADTGAEGGAPLAGEPIVVTHPTQPMVVDVRLPVVDGAAVVATVPADPGARVAPLPGAPAGEAWFRVRGLEPATDLAIELVVSRAGESTTRTASFRTLDPLPGYVASFPVAVTGAHHEGLILFDYSSSRVDDSGLYVIETNGKTRFYLPHASSLSVTPPIPQVPAGLSMREDGTILFNQDYALLALDELGAEILRVDAAENRWFHHESVALPGGDQIALAHEFREVQYPGEPTPRYLTGDRVVRVDAGGAVVWEWSSFDHLPTDRIRSGYETTIAHPVTARAGHDWTHGNAMAYDPGADAIVVSFRHLDWLTAIDAATGAVRWNLGEGGDFALAPGDSWFFHQHSPELQPDGSWLLYDNGNGNPGVPPTSWRSRAVRLELDEAANRADVVWELVSPFVSPVAGDANRLPSGHYLVTDSYVVTSLQSLGDASAAVREVDPATGDEPWRLVLPKNRFIYRCSPVDRLPGEPSPG
ncbi:MAG: aryl-sulfate sulfotransferase [Polyangiaceae bacterium]|nr:aryl-sulfate sulfotransferase [Polyangiaceae bacterium]